MVTPLILLGRDSRHACAHNTNMLNTDPNSKQEDAVLRRKPDPAEPFCALVFKIVADRHGDLHYVRVYSGELKANSRVYNLAFSTGDSFQQIGTDGGLLPAPVTLTNLLLATGERADIVVDFSPYSNGTEILLTNKTGSFVRCWSAESPFLKHFRGQSHSTA